MYVFYLPQLLLSEIDLPVECLWW